MKTLIFSLVLTLFAGLTHAQEITELEEARVGFAPLSAEVFRDGDIYSYNVDESYVKEFETDPLLFMKNYFNIKNFISEVQGEGFSSYQVTFRSSRGNLQANFNRKGQLVQSTSVFKDILLPKELRHQLYRDHKGWEMTKNKHITRGRDGIVNQDLYKIKIVNGKERKNIVLEAPLKAVAVVSK